MVKTAIFLVTLALLYQAQAMPQDAAPAAEPAAELLLQISAALISCKTAADADAPVPEAPVEVEGFPVDKTLLADAEVTAVLTTLRTRKCKNFKRTTLGMMMNKKA